MKSASPKKSRVRVARITEVRIWGGSVNVSNVACGYMPNPWPSDIVSAVTFACTCIAARPIFTVIKLWIDERKARKIIIKHGEIEMHIEGGVTERMLRSRIVQFRKLVKDCSKDDIEVIIPPRLDPTLPRVKQGATKKSTTRNKS